MLLRSAEHGHRLANAVVAITGIGYFIAWSASFYPQIILNYRRKQTAGLSNDFVVINPVGFLALSIWNWGVYFSPKARDQYKRRHDGHSPQISAADLAFSSHAFIISAITLVQVIYYAWRNRHHAKDVESSPLLRDQTRDNRDLQTLTTTSWWSTVRPSNVMSLSLIAMIISTFVSGVFVWTGKTELLDWLYFVSTLKLIISLVKYIPQVVLNYRLKSVEGLAIDVILLDLTGSFLSFAQLGISSIWIEHDPSGIIANPAKLGLSFLSLSFDIILVTQNYYLYPKRKIDESEDDREA